MFAQTQTAATLITPAAATRVDGAGMLLIALDSSTDTITAHSGGGQANAVPLVSRQNRVTVVAVANDSVLLPPATVGQQVTISNAAGANLGVYPSSAAQGGVTGGDSINALSQNAIFVQATGRQTFRCYTIGVWQTA